MAEHHVSVTVNAPLHQVYTLFTHFNDFPKFMSFVKEVTYTLRIRRSVASAAWMRFLRVFSDVPNDLAISGRVIP